MILSAKALRIVPLLVCCCGLPTAFAADPGVGPALAPAPSSAPPTVSDTAPARLCLDAAISAPGSNLGYCDLVISRLSESGATDPATIQQLAAALSNRAIAAQREGAYDSAEADLQRALDIAGPKPDLLLNRGNLRLAQRRYGEALGDYSEALRLSQGTLRAAHYNSAFAHRALGRIPEAVADELRARGHRVDILPRPDPS